MVHRLGHAVLLAGLLIVVAACKGDERREITVASDRITVVNMTDTAWSDVDVWLNDHYRAQARELAVGQRLEVPIDVFIAGFGQRFDKKKQIPFRVEVDATGANGKPVRVIWGKGRRR
jgi:hypothetical protein